MHKKYSRECAWCGKSFETFYQDKLCCNHICSSKRNKEVSKIWYKKRKEAMKKKRKNGSINNYISKEKYVDKTRELKRRYNQYKSSAKLKEHEFNLSFKEFEKLLCNKCYYCGISANPFNGIDRVNSSFGYTKNNSVSSCIKCNRMKLDMTKEDFAEQIVKLQEWAHSVLKDEK